MSGGLSLMRGVESSCSASFGKSCSATLRARLFDSMVSLRPPEGGGEAVHLGLGLYIVRIVAEFHGGSVRAANLPGDAGVRFEVELP